MNKGDDILFRKRRMECPSMRAKALYSLNPYTFKGQNVDNKLKQQYRQEYLEAVRLEY